MNEMLSLQDLLLLIPYVPIISQKICNQSTNVFFIFCFMLNGEARKRLVRKANCEKMMHQSEGQALTPNDSLLPNRVQTLYSKCISLPSLILTYHNPFVFVKLYFVTFFSLLSCIAVKMLSSFRCT